MTDVIERAVPGTYPVPAGRGRWRITLHNRVFSTSPTYPGATGIGELTSARARTLTQAWDSAAQFVFTVDGHSPNALAIRELQQDVICWRWDDQTGADIPMFRGIIGQSEDQLTEQQHTVTFTCHDYLAMLARRYYTTATPLVYTAIEQDQLVTALLGIATGSTAAQNFPLVTQMVNPDGSARSTPSGQIRARTYLGGQEISTAIDELAKVLSGYDYDCWPRSDLNGVDYLRVFYPSQGVARPDVVLSYGSSISALTRTDNSNTYTNFWYVLGNNGTSDPNAAQLISIAQNADAGGTTFGMWQNLDNASAVNQQATLDQQAQGDLAISGLLMPSYTVTLRPGAYSYGNPNMGDTVTLIVNSGRLQVNTTQRVLGISYAIGDDGQEDVTLTLGRNPTTLFDVLDNAATDINALARR